MFTGIVETVGEVLAVEPKGELTRLIALFHSRGSDPVGPTRSVRTSDLLILANQNMPLLGNSGGGSLFAFYQAQATTEPAPEPRPGPTGIL